MSDIVERLRAWVYTDAQYATAREAADEIERLRGLLSRTGSDAAKTCDKASECRSHGVKTPERERLTDEEREAVRFCTTAALPETEKLGGVAGELCRMHGATLRALLERLGDTPDTHATRSGCREQDRCTLTNDEREAVAWAAAIEPEPSGRWTKTNEAAWNQRSATLRALLERLSNPPGTDRQ